MKRHISVILKHNMYIFGGVDQDHRRWEKIKGEREEKVCMCDSERESWYTSNTIIID